MSKEASEREKKNREELFRLMKENPDLPVVPMVDADIVADDCGYWMGSWGSSRIQEYMLGEEQVYFREDDDPSEIEKVISHEVGMDEWEAMTDKQAEQTYKEMPWIRAIVVYINYPEA